MAEPTSTSPDELLEVALAAADQGGQVLAALQHRRRQTLRRKRSPFDLVTEGDGAAEETIVRVIRQRRPHDQIEGEEHGRYGGCGRVRWVIDPLDGTTNYVQGLLAWAVSIAAKVGDRTLAAVVHAPALGRTYTATLHGGAWCNGQQLGGPQATDLGDAVIATGFSSSPDKRIAQLRQVEAVLPSVRDVRCHGSAALELCAVAAGTVDAYFESDLEEWDVAAGIAMVREAGATVSGSPPVGDTLIASSPELAQALARRLRVLHPIPDLPKDPM